MNVPVGSLMPQQVNALPPVQRKAVQKLRRGVLAGLVDLDSRSGRRLYLLTPAELARELL